MPLRPHTSWLIALALVSLVTGPARSQSSVEVEVLAGASAACGVWSPVMGPEAPFDLHDFMPVLDAARNRVLVFGGRSADGSLKRDLWLLDLNGAGAWRIAATTGTPPSSRAEYSAIVDPVRNRMLLFGGTDGSLRNDLWALDLETLAWTLIATNGPAPAPRRNHTAVYDSMRDRMIVISGLGGFSVNADAHALSLASATWATLPAPGANPGIRGGHTALYDPARDRIVVYGGVGPGTLFELDLATPAWSALDPVGVPPAPRTEHTAVFDAARDRMLVFGGMVGSETTNESWSLEFAPGPQWIALAIAGEAPAPRRSHGAVLDDDTMVVLGAAGETADETWRLTVAPTLTWGELVPAGKPMPERESHTTIWDSATGGLWVWGGRSGEHTWEHDLWFLDPTAPAWTHISTTGITPAARDEHTAIFDSKRRRMVMFGGRSDTVHGDLWTLDLSGPPVWSSFGIPGPEARFGHAAVLDPVRDRMIVFGGATLGSIRNDVWALSLATGTWMSLAPAGAPPPARFGHLAVYDPVRDRVLVIGGTDGSSRFNDVWALDLAGGTAWSALAPTGAAPPEIEGHAGAYDPVGDRVVFFGGNTSSGKSSSTWALMLAGTPSWQPVLADLFVPQARTQHAAVWDEVANRLLISGGFSLIRRTNDVAAFSSSSLVPLSVTAAPTIGGSTTRVPSRSCFAPTSSVSITALPAAGYGFGGWSGDASGTQNPLVVPMTTARNIVASFTGHTVAVRPNPVGTGLVTRTPDRATYAPGELVTLTATALDGAMFTHWSGGASGSTNPLTIEVQGSLDIVANFVGFPIFTHVSPEDGGLIERVPETPVYAPGTQVQLRAVGVGGRVFSHWSGDLSGNLNPITVTLDHSLDVVANFIGHPLTTSVAPAGSGLVTLTPSNPYYAPGATVQLKALPSHDNDFTHWTGDASGTSLTVDVVMDGPKTVTANFERGVYSLTTSVYPPGAGTVGREPETQRYAPGRVVTVTANPQPGQFAFIGWSGDTTTSASANPIAVTMNRNRSLTANFVGYQLTRTVTPVHAGTLTAAPDYPFYAPGTVVTVRAVPVPGYHFIGWKGGLSGTENPTTITMDQARTITAEFNTFPLELLVQPPASGTVSTFPARPTYALGDTVTLTAVPAPGRYGFSHWSGAVTGNQNPVTIVIDGFKSVTANFVGYPLTVTIDPLAFGRVALNPSHSTYAPGSVVTLTAVDSLAPFVQWFGDVTGIDNPTTLVMDGPKSVSAQFYGFRVHVQTDPPDPRLYVVRYPDQDGYTLGSGMILEAPTHLGVDFLNWTGDLEGTQNPVLFQITGEMYITAHFGGKAVNTSVEPPDGGSVAKNPPKPLYAPGRTITLEAIPAPGLVFTGWTGDRTGPNPLIMTMPDDTVDVVAHFAPALPRCMAWRTVTTPNSPGPRTRHAMAFDYVRQRMIMFGGLSGRFDRNNDVWVKPLSDDSAWVRLDALGEPPEGRFSSSAVHDPVRNRLIVFGGRAPSGVKNDVWAINLDGTPTWTQLQPTGALPVTRFGASVVYDPRGDRMIVFGGNATVSTRNDTWALNLSGQPAWVQLNPQNPPPGRYYANTVYDHVRNRMIVIGGRGRFEETQMDDAWFLPLSPPAEVAPELAGNFVNWSRLSPAGFAPDARDGAGAAFDPIRDRVVFAGGAGAYSLLDDVAELSLVGRTAWNRPQVPVEHQPLPNTNGSMVFDAARDRVLIYGGELTNGAILDDLVEISFANGLSLNVIVDPPGTGTFTISPTDPCVTPGTPMTFEAFAVPGYRFVTWENLATEQNPTTWNAAKHMSVIARFAPFTTDVGAGDAAFGIRGVYPNPTRGAVRIDYSLPAEARVRLTVLDVSGRVISNPVEGTRAAGAHSESWDGRTAGRPAPEGIYFLRLSAGAHTAFRRVVLLR
jgi:uncharacterized repeat protein (TIGR02543 family)